MSICETIKTHGGHDDKDFTLRRQIAVISINLISVVICTYLAYVVNTLVNEDKHSKLLNTILVAAMAMLWLALFLFICRIRKTNRTHAQKWEDIKTMLVTTWCATGMLFVTYVIACPLDYSMYEVNNVLYGNYTSVLFDRYVTDWADETRKDGDYTAIMQDDGWIGIDLHDSQGACVSIAIKTPNGSTYTLPSINTTTQRVLETVKKYSEGFNTQDYIDAWDTYHNNEKRYPNANEDIPSKDILLEDAEYIKYKLSELVTDLQDVKVGYYG